MILVLPKFKIVQNLIDKLNGVARENLTGIRIIRAFNGEKYQEDKFEEKIKEYRPKYEYHEYLLFMGEYYLKYPKN